MEDGCYFLVIAENTESLEGFVLLDKPCEYCWFNLFLVFCLKKAGVEKLFSIPAFARCEILLCDTFTLVPILPRFFYTIQKTSRLDKSWLVCKTLKKPDLLSLGEISFYTSKVQAKQK